MKAPKSKKQRNSSRTAVQNRRRTGAFFEYTELSRPTGRQLGSTFLGRMLAALSPKKGSY